MARSYTVGEAARILVEGTDFEAIQDLGRRFPIFSNKLMKAAAGDKDGVLEFVAGIPDYVNPRKMEKVFVNGQAETDEPDAPVEEEATKEEPKPKRRGRKAAPKKEEPEPDTAGDEEAQDGKYAGKNAMELFKECKKRGIKAQPKKPVAYYIELLEEDDEVTASESKDDADDDDDWDI